jgi:lysozyme
MIREMLKRHEGLRLKKYRDTTGHWTIGYGWNLDANPLPPDMAACLRSTGAITIEMAEWLLDVSIDCAIKQCRSIYPGFDEFTEARRAALIDFVFNLGVKGALKFTKMMAAIKAGNWSQAADDMYFSDWREQVGPNRSEEIISLIRVG